MSALMSVQDKVAEIIVKQLGVKPEQVIPEAEFVDDLGADSLDTVELIMAFEEEFGIEISDEDAEKIRRGQDAVDYVNKEKEKSARVVPSNREVRRAILISRQSFRICTESRFGKKT